MDTTPNLRLGSFELIAPIGMGANGEVYRARDTRRACDVAVRLLPAQAYASPEARIRLEHDAKAVSSLNHPRICVTHSFGRDGETNYMVMDLVEGETLAQRLVMGAMPATEVIEVGIQLADALECAHRAGVVHRDLKPRNVILTASGPMLMDFGLGRAVGRWRPSQPQLPVEPDVIAGASECTAPEQLHGRMADARSDVWALGCMLHQMATGRPAFEGENHTALIDAILGSTPIPISQLTPFASPALERLVQTCLARDPADRVQSASQVKLELARIAAGGSRAGSETTAGSGRTLSGRPGPSGEIRPVRRLEVSAPGVAALGLGALVAILWLRAIGGTAAAVPRMDPTFEGASLRWAMSLASGRIDEIARTQGRVPGSLAEIGGHPLDSIEYARVSDDRYRLSAPSSRGPIVFDSVQRREAFVGESRRILSDRAPGTTP